MSLPPASRMKAGQWNRSTNVRRSSGLAGYWTAWLELGRCFRKTKFNSQACEINLARHIDMPRPAKHRRSSCHSDVLLACSKAAFISSPLTGATLIADKLFSLAVLGDSFPEGSGMPNNNNTLEGRDLCNLKSVQINGKHSCDLADFILLHSRTITTFFNCHTLLLVFW